jgi:putative acetyltransferase
MSGTPEIRESTGADAALIESLYLQAFPEEDLVPLVHSLLRDEAIRLSLVTTIGKEVVGHVMFTHCRIDENDTKAALLGPLAVKPAHQRQGIGSAIVNEGLRRLKEAGVTMVLVLGDPAYYGRLGFTADENVLPPYELPDDWAGAWQSQYLVASDSQVAGRLLVPVQWRQVALWSP